MNYIQSLGITKLVKIAQSAPPNDPQLAKEELIQADFLYLRGIKNAAQKPVFSQETIISIISKVYFLKEGTVEQIIYGNYQRRRIRKKNK